jgi:hypothetical protein
VVRTPVLAGLTALFGALCPALVLVAAVAAQVVSPGLEQANPEMTAAVETEVRQRVAEFVRKLGNRDAAGVRALLAPKALIAVVRRESGDRYTASYETGDEYLARFEKNASQPKFEGRLADPVITIDSGHLAHVRAEFQIVREGKVAASGVDQFTLVKERDGWKIAVMAYTSIPER